MNDVPVRDAATVVLLRDGDEGLEVWLLTRVTQMVFAAGMSVFPGGRVDPDDGALPFVGADFTGVADRFGCSVEVARALVGAAARETFEETGVLLSVPAADLADRQADVETGRVSFGELLRSHDLAIDAGALHPWARWVTPEGEVRRYDTRFFVGGLPVDAVARDVTTESSEASWLGIGTAIEQAQRGERGLLPPTMVTLAALQSHATVSEVLAAAADRPIDAIQPTLQVADDGSVTVTLPDGTTTAIPRSMVAPPKAAGGG